MEEDIQVQQDAAAVEHMQEVDAQFQAHDFQQMMVEASERAQAAPEMGMEMEI